MYVTSLSPRIVNFLSITNEFKRKEDGIQNKVWIKNFEQAIYYVYEGHDMKRLIKTNVSISDWIANQRSGRVTLVGGKKCLIYLLNKLAAMVKLDNI